MADFLLELFSEEIPSRMQRKAASDLRSLVTNALVDNGLTYEGAKEYWTPRRLVLDIRGLTSRSADLKEEKKGPRVDAPEQAIAGFLRGAGLSSVDEAEVRTDPKKGDFYVAIIEKSGQDAQQIIQQVLPSILKNFPWPKSMRWGAGSADSGSLKWVRPLQSILCLFGEVGEMEVVSFEVEGVEVSNTTSGHRFLKPGTFEVSDFEDYASKLGSSKVMLDTEKRKETILADAKNLAFAKGLELVEDNKLLEEVAGLVEWPITLMGEFDADFLGIPSEVVQLTIRENQKCFVVSKQGSDELSNHFMLVSNIEPKDGGVEVSRGNAKVVNARLSDAKFFWESDLHQINSDEGFQPWIDKLGNVTFHAKLGMQSERVNRIIALAEKLAPVIGADAELAKRAAQLCKADLNSAMVYEFPEVQGLMGRYYAQKSGEDDSVALAIEEHYSPLGPSDSVPKNPVSISVALADKLDLLTSFWSIDEKPTGRGDPFALRRAALGVIRLILDNEIKLNILNIVKEAYKRIIMLLFRGGAPYQRDGNYFRVVGNINYSTGEPGPVEEINNEFGVSVSSSHVGFHWTFENLQLDEPIFLGPRIDFENRSGEYLAPVFLTVGYVAEFPSFNEFAKNLLSFFHDRLKVYLRDRDIRHDVIDAVLTSDADDLLTIYNKALALQKLIDSEDGENLLASYKRAANKLVEEEKKGTKIADSVGNDLLQVEAEQNLASAIEAASSKAEAQLASENYEGAMGALSALRKPLDQFFTDVMVNDDDLDIRANRLALLAKIRDAMSAVADFSKISG